MSFGRLDRGVIWTNENTIKLISLYKAFPVVFDTSSIGYKDKVLKQEVWQSIGNQLGTSSKFVLRLANYAIWC